MPVIAMSSDAGKECIEGARKNLRDHFRKAYMNPPKDLFELKNSAKYLVDWFRLGVQEAQEGKPFLGPISEPLYKAAYLSGYQLGSNLYGLLEPTS